MLFILSLLLIYNTLLVSSVDQNTPSGSPQVVHHHHHHIIHSGGPFAPSVGPQSPAQPQIFFVPQGGLTPQFGHLPQVSYIPQIGATPQTAPLPQTTSPASSVFEPHQQAALIAQMLGSSAYPLLGAARQAFAAISPTRLNNDTGDSYLKAAQQEQLKHVLLQEMAAIINRMFLPLPPYQQEVHWQQLENLFKQIHRHGPRKLVSEDDKIVLVVIPKRTFMDWANIKSQAPATPLRPAPKSDFQPSSRYQSGTVRAYLPISSTSLVNGQQGYHVIPLSSFQGVGGPTFTTTGLPHVAISSHVAVPSSSYQTYSFPAVSPVSDPNTIHPFLKQLYGLRR